MAPLPKRRWSTQRQGKKRATLKAFAKAMIRCDNCGQLKSPHCACPKCGYYRGKQITKIKERKLENQKRPATPEKKRGS